MGGNAIAKHPTCTLLGAVLVVSVLLALLQVPLASAAAAAAAPGNWFGNLLSGGDGEKKKGGDDDRAKQQQMQQQQQQQMQMRRQQLQQARGQPPQGGQRPPPVYGDGLLPPQQQQPQQQWDRPGRTAVASGRGPGPRGVPIQQQQPIQPQQRQAPPFGDGPPPPPPSRQGGDAALLGEKRGGENADASAKTARLDGQDDGRGAGDGDGGDSAAAPTTRSDDDDDEGSSKDSGGGGAAERAGDDEEERGVGAAAPPMYDPFAAAGYWSEHGPPPPPPALSAGADDEGGRRYEGQEREQEQQQGGWNEGQQQPPPPPPMGQFWGYTPPPQQQEQQHPPIPPSGYDEWQAAQQQQQQQQQIMMGQQQHQAQYEDWEQTGPQDGYGTDEVQSLRTELDSSAAREADLTYRVTNLTSSLAAAEETAATRLHTIDVLTERISDAEARASAGGNAVRELRANCTELRTLAGTLRAEVEEWEEKCAAFEEGRASDAETMEELREALRSRQADLEELACAIEVDRVDAERERYQAERNRRRKKRGLLAWIFAGIFGGDDDEEGDRLKAQELSRSTLLHALQTERNNVDELEAALLTLQQNNSAIADMVTSRDSLINELNDRVAVFEEDKIVLKAALRQLQKEMKEEAPKTQKVIADLKKARGKINTLQSEIETLQSKHADETAELRSQIDQREMRINETESKMSMIATYVDQLEERLASFAIARRQIGEREEKCKELEVQELEREKERVALERKVEELTEEKAEMKNLMDLLVEERGVLRRDKAELERKNNVLEREGQAAKARLDEQELKVQRLAEDADEWKRKFDGMEEERIVLQERLEVAERRIEATELLSRSEEEEVPPPAESEVEPIPCSEADVFYDAVGVSTEEIEVSPSLPCSPQSEEATVVGVNEYVAEEAHEPEGTVLSFPLREDAIEKDASLEAEEVNVPGPPEVVGNVADRSCEVTLPGTSNNETLSGAITTSMMADWEDSEYSDEEGYDEHVEAASVAPSDVNVTPPQVDQTAASAPPSLPIPGQPRPSTTLPPGPPRKLLQAPTPPVPFRTIRKAFSRATGVHGFFTPPSSKRQTPPRQLLSIPKVAENGNK